MSWKTIASDHIVRIAGWRRMFRATLLSCVVLCAQSGDWAQVQALTPGSRLDVKRRSGGGELHGVLERASQDALVLQNDSGAVTVDKADVRRVRLRTEKKSKSGRLAGAAVGGAFGALSAGMSDKQQGGSGAGRAIAIPVFAGIGYLIGWGADGPKHTTIYDAQKP